MAFLSVWNTLLAHTCGPCLSSLSSKSGRTLKMSPLTNAPLEPSGANERASCSSQLIRLTLPPSLAANAEDSESVNTPSVLTLNLWAAPCADELPRTPTGWLPGLFEFSSTEISTKGVCDTNSESIESCYHVGFLLSSL